MKNQHCIDTIVPSSASVSFGLPPWIVAGLSRLARWLEVRRQRQHLASLDDRMLRDIGLSRVDVLIESEKPFWRL
ncbi:MAG: DUF1127 domain-containing protein [Pseudomonadota bacterium]